MPAPGSATYSAEAKVTVHTALRDLLDTGGPAVIKIRNGVDTLLATITLTDPCGTVNGTTGQLTLTAAGDATAVATSLAAYGEVCESDGTVHLSLPTQEGSSPVSGKLVINETDIFTGGTVTLVSATIG